MTKFAVPFTFLAIWIFCIGSWIANIVKLFVIINDPVSGMMILRAVGIFLAPLGVVLGWM